MGALADAFVAFARPLLDQTDGSKKQLDNALSISQFCYNLGVLPEEIQQESIDDMGRKLSLNDQEFKDFRSVVESMLQRHKAMFPGLHGRAFAGPTRHAEDNDDPDSARTRWSVAPPAKKPVITDRYAPCPCNSGKKYKFCCDPKGR